MFNSSKSVYFLGKSGLAPTPFLEEDFNRIFTFINQINFAIMDYTSSNFHVEVIKDDSNPNVFIVRSLPAGKIVFHGDDANDLLIALSK